MRTDPNTNALYFLLKEYREFSHVLANYVNRLQEVNLSFATLHPKNKAPKENTEFITGNLLFTTQKVR